MTQNPLSGTSRDSEIFSNADQLEWNQKKHNMILNLGLTTNSESDQTPTPTRFIRNCEEVGLFQDLQNVNPFDEVFKKAVENPASVNLQTPVSSSDDTLHTPQIYPELEETSKFPKSAANTNINEYVTTNIDQTDEDDNPLIIVLDPEKDNDNPSTKTPTKTSLIETNARDKIKSAIIKKSGGITPVPLEKLLDHGKQNIKKVNQNTLHFGEILKQREANKAAQRRCRKRKQQEFEDLKLENNLLRNKNARLTAINLDLQQIIKSLQEDLKEARLTSRIAKKMSTSPTGPIRSETTCDTTTNSALPPTILQKQSVKPNTIGNSPTQPPPIAPKNMVLSLPVMKMPLQTIRNTKNVVLVYPVPSK